MNCKTIVVIVLIPFVFTGCIVGNTLALPFKVTGAVVNIVTPDVVGDSIAGVGDVVEVIVPF